MGETDRDFDIVAGFPDQRRADASRRTSNVAACRSGSCTSCGRPGRPGADRRDAKRDGRRGRRRRRRSRRRLLHGGAGAGCDDGAVVRDGLVGLLLGLAVGALLGVRGGLGDLGDGTTADRSVCFAIGGIIAGFVAGGALQAAHRGDASSGGRCSTSARSPASAARSSRCTCRATTRRPWCRRSSNTRGPSVSTPSNVTGRPASTAAASIRVRPTRPGTGQGDGRKQRLKRRGPFGAQSTLMPLVITRRETFSAGHTLFNPAFSPERNREVFGKCSNPNGHGHNYVLEVSLAGEVDPETGFVYDLSELAAIDPQGDPGRGRPPQPQLRRRLAARRDPDDREPRLRVLGPARREHLRLPAGSVRLQETEKNWAERRRG